MTDITIDAYIAKQRKLYDDTRTNSTRGSAALVLANMALQHDSDSAHAAASLLLSMESCKAFDFRLLLKFDPKHRAYADTVVQGYVPHEIWPSKWIDEEGGDGETLMRQLSDKWPSEAI